MSRHVFPFLCGFVVALAMAGSSPDSLSKRGVASGGALSEEQGPVERAPASVFVDSRETLWSHLEQGTDFSDRQVTAVQWTREGSGTLGVEVVSKATYAWADIPAPAQGWRLAARTGVEGTLKNSGAVPIQVMLWVVGSRGWDAVGDGVKLAPGESRTVRAKLREPYPDGTPKLDPGSVKKVQVMFASPVVGARVELTGLAAVGDTAPWVRPEGRMEVPEMETRAPAAGLRVRYVLPEERQTSLVRQTSLYSVLQLPQDWKPGGSYPVIVEYPGNVYFEAGTCYSSGLPEHCVIGHGISKGQGAIWVCLPFVDYRKGAVERDGWGNPGDTADYAVRVVEAVCRDFGGDAHNVVLTGFSRGAIACGFIGLRDERVAGLWKAFHACQHYDGDGWRGADMAGAVERASRFKGKSVFQTDNPPEPFQPVMSRMGVPVQFATSGLKFHACAMFLDERDSARQLREWFWGVVKGS